MSRENQALVTVTVDGVSLGTFEEREGGDTDSNETTYPLGGMGPTISLGGTQSVDNVTVRVLYTDAIRARRKWLRGRAGKGSIVVTEQPLNTDGVADGEPDVWRGTLKRVKTPNRAADSNNAAQLELEMTVSGGVG